ncbi:MAG: hypothetical protein ACFFDH_09335 [Promethearchaeota archaeon]
MSVKKCCYGISILLLVIICMGHSPVMAYSSYQEFFKLPSLSTGDNKAIIDSAFNKKIDDYYDKGYFPQVYEPSLQATYYALYILDTIGKLDYINQTEIVNYIMSHYDSSSYLFMDTLAYRYLGIDFSLTYYPFSSVLETNCYGVLSLDILGELSSINIPEMINFIWDCQSPVSGGFIGQRYDSGLDEGFKIATADNAYFAVKTLDLLMADWTGYSTEKNAIIQFLDDLQLLGGGFENDEDGSFDSLRPFFEPSLLSSYYCIKALETFGMESVINIPNFHQYLTSLNETNYFRMSNMFINENDTNIVATSLGLELSDITNFTSINRDNIISFILNNRNSLGNWDQSTTVTIHELIDTYQIIRSLNDTQVLSGLTPEEKSEIGNATLKYQSYRGFSLLSEDYTSMDLIHTVVKSFDLYDRLSDLDIPQLYAQVKDSYNNFAEGIISRYFYGYLIGDTQCYGFRSHPIEYYSTGDNAYIQEFSRLYSHQSTYYALDTLQTLFKLDDFGLEYNLMQLINDIIATQFLNDTYYDKFGAFSHLMTYNAYYSEIISKMIYFEYSYYAIRCLKLLAAQLSLNLEDLSIDKLALFTHIDRNIVETPTTLYFDPQYTSKIEKILENTYYIIYVLKALNMYTLNNNKIKNYVTSNLNYSNIKNIYYSYKISELLGINIDFDVHLIHELIETIFSEDHYEFYLTSEKNIMDPEVFLWVCDMARNSKIQIEAHYSDTIQLGSVNKMEASLYNLILKDFGNYITFKFESPQIGTYVFSKTSNNTYIHDIPVPVSYESYPMIGGYLRAYEGAQLKAEQYVSFSTNYTLEYNVKYSSELSRIVFEINTSIVANGVYFPLTSGRVYMKVYKNGNFVREVQATHLQLLDKSVFTISYNPTKTGQFSFEIYLNDGISSSEINIETIPLIITEVAKNYEGEIATAIPLTVIFIAVPGTVVFLSSRQLRKVRKTIEHQ